MDSDDGKVEETLQKMGTRSAERRADNFTRGDIDLDAIRARIARMSDKELEKYGASAAWLLSAPGLAVVAARQLEEARAEWRRRHPKAAGKR